MQTKLCSWLMPYAPGFCITLLSTYLVNVSKSWWEMTEDACQPKDIVNFFKHSQGICLGISLGVPIPQSVTVSWVPWFDLNCFYYWIQYFRTLTWGSICSNPCESELTCFRPESNRGPAALVVITIPIPQSTIHIQIYHFKTTFICLRSIAGVPFDSVRRFRASLLLHTTSVRS